MMTPARETLQSWLHRPFFLAMMAAVLSTVLLLGASLFVVIQQIQQRESDQMNAQGERFLQRLEQLFGQLRESLDDLQNQTRSEARRVGKEGGSTCRYRWSPEK